MQSQKIKKESNIYIYSKSFLQQSHRNGSRLPPCKDTVQQEAESPEILPPILCP